MRNPINDFEELENVIKKLSSPKPGFKRVFRGQTENYPKMLSSACRPNATTKGFLWKLALINVPEISGSLQKSKDSGIDFIMNFNTWWEALIQHYGPGSPYLDVTTSIDVALWFALNYVRSTTRDYWYELPGHPRIPMRIPTLNFYPKSQGTSWIYVLDVPVWDGDSLTKHGDFIDLTKGSGIVSSCLRMKRQNGGLVFGDKKTEDGDLSSFFACDPIEISWPFKGANLINMDYTYFFPPPEEDEWFKMLLKAPLVPHIDEKNGFIYKQSLEVYIIADPPDLKKDLSALQLQTEELSMLVRSLLRIHPKTLNELRTTNNANPEDSTYIQVGIPLYTALPSTTYWNQAVLEFGLRKNAQVKLLNEDIKLPVSTLENVIFEFSPLETVFLSGAQNQDQLTALWIIIDKEIYRCTYFFNHKNHLNFTTATIEFIYSDKNARYEVKQKDKFVSLTQSAIPETWIKFFFISLYMLNGLSSSIKPEPFISYVFGGRGILPIRGMGLMLVKARNDPMDMRLHFLVNTLSGKPYEGPTFDFLSIGAIEIDSAEKYPAYKSIREIYGYASVIDNSFPHRESDGFDPEIADYFMDIYT